MANKHATRLGQCSNMKRPFAERISLMKPIFYDMYNDHTFMAHFDADHEVYLRSCVQGMHGFSTFANKSSFDAVAPELLPLLFPSVFAAIRFGAHDTSQAVLETFSQLMQIDEYLALFVQDRHIAEYLDATIHSWTLFTASEIPRKESKDLECILGRLTSCVALHDTLLHALQTHTHSAILDGLKERLESEHKRLTADRRDRDPIPLVTDAIFTNIRGIGVLAAFSKPLRHAMFRRGILTALCSIFIYVIPQSGETPRSTAFDDVSNVVKQLCPLLAFEELGSTSAILHALDADLISGLARVVSTFGNDMKTYISDVSFLLAVLFRWVCKSKRVAKKTWESLLSEKKNKLDKNILWRTIDVAEEPGLNRMVEGYVLLEKAHAMLFVGTSCTPKCSNPKCLNKPQSEHGGVRCAKCRMFATCSKECFVKALRQGKHTTEGCLEIVKVQNGIDWPYRKDARAGKDSDDDDDSDSELSGSEDGYETATKSPSKSLELPIQTRTNITSSFPSNLHRQSIAMVNVDGEIQILKDAMKEFGTKNADGKYSVSYGTLFEKTANTLEALNGTLRAAKRQKKVAFDAELLMHPKDKDVQVVLLEE